MLLRENRYGRKSRNLHSCHLQLKTAVLILLRSTQQPRLWEQLGAIHDHSWKEWGMSPPAISFCQWEMGAYCNTVFPSNVPGRARLHKAYGPLLQLFYLQRLFLGAEDQQKGREVSKAVVVIVQWLGKDSRGSFVILKCTCTSVLLLICFTLAARKGEEILNQTFFQVIKLLRDVGAGTLKEKKSRGVSVICVKFASQEHRLCFE